MTGELLKLEGAKTRQYDISEVYRGTMPIDGETMYVVKRKDTVIDSAVGMYYVLDVDNDNIPTMELIFRRNESSNLNPNSESLITAFSKYQPSAAQYALVNTDVTPHTVAISNSYLVFGADRDRMVFYLGSDVSEDTGIILSEVYDGTGALIGNEVGLEAVQSGVNTIKIPNIFHTTKPLKSGDIITGVVHTATGDKVQIQPFLVEDTSFVRDVDASALFITDLSIQSPLLSPTDDTLLENNVNTPFTTSLIKGRLHYSDGSTVNVPVNGTKLVLHGLDEYDNSRVGRPHNLVLTYYPDTTENYVGGGGATRPQISRHVRLANRRVGDDYSLKLYPVPAFVDAVTGYQFQWWLNNIDGDINIDVTAHIRTHRPDGTPLNGLDYGVEQNLSLTLDLDDVAPGTYPGYIHSQIMDMTLSIPGANGDTPWFIDYASNNALPYGQGVRASATNVGDGKINVSMDEPTREAWLTRAYYSILPLYDNSVLVEPPTPSHMLLRYNGVEHRVPLERWSGSINKLTGAPVFVDQSTLDIVWVLATATGDKYLGHTPMIIRLDL